MQQYSFRINPDVNTNRIAGLWQNLAVSVLQRLDALSLLVA